MRIETRDAVWMAVGAVLLLLLTVVVLRYYNERDVTKHLTLRARRIELVSRLRTNLASAAEAEKSAVLAVTDEESRTFADRARALGSEVENARQELSTIIESDGTRDERDALAQFSRAFLELHRIDDDILSLAVKNTNLKASALTYGPATDAVNEMTGALTTFAEDHGAESSAASTEGARATRLAARAEIAALRVLTMLPPHIAEQSDETMTEMEARIASTEDEVRRALDELAALPIVANRPELATAKSAWARFGELKAQVVALSRENTNVRSLDMSLNRKRAVLTVCENALATLQQAVDAEHVGDTGSGRWALPR